MDGKDRYELLLDAVEIERSGEEAYYHSMAIEKSFKERESAGILWRPVVILKQHYSIGELIEIEVERVRNINRSHKFKAGKGAIMYFNDDQSNSFKGVISFVKRNILRIILHSDHVQKSEMLQHKTAAVELTFDDRPYRLMRSALEQLSNLKYPHHIALRDGLRKQTISNHKLDNHAEHYQSSDLNDFQNEAIRGCAAADVMSIIHGPPGTGKTTTLVALIHFLSKSEKKILVCAPSNNAVDLLARKLSEKNLRVVRVGNVTRMNDNIAHLSIEEKARNHDDWQHIKRVKIEAENARKMSSKYKRSFGAKEKADRNAYYKEFKDLKKWAKDLEAKLMEQILDDAQVICTTLIGSAHHTLKGMLFESLIIDEASQALEPECWVAMLKAKRVIFAGDHKQLPPTIKNRAAAQLGLDQTILSRMSNNVESSYFLGMQYRMNDKILQFSNQKFYEGKLKSHESNMNHQLDGDENVMVFIDTAGCGFDEAFNPQYKSLSNEGEFFILAEHFLRMDEKLNDVSIGIISPYAEQVRFIRDKRRDYPIMDGKDIEINTIDGFQGQEKDVIYISLVRSNEKSEIGFLKDYRRINVALTRARKKLIIIGDGATLSNDPMYADLMDHVEQNATYQSAWEYMA